MLSWFCLKNLGDLFDSEGHLFDSEGHLFLMDGFIFDREEHLFDRKGHRLWEGSQFDYKLLGRGIFDHVYEP